MPGFPVTETFNTAGHSINDALSNVHVIPLIKDQAKTFGKSQALLFIFNFLLNISFSYFKVPRGSREFFSVFCC